jgi:hypothetical protein
VIEVLVSIHVNTSKPAMLWPTFIAKIFSAGVAKHFLKKSLDHGCALTEYCLQAFS